MIGDRFLSGILPTPSLATLSVHQENFVEKRHAIQQTRTVDGQVTAAIKEIAEATEEIWSIDTRPSRRQRHLYTEELADVVIYTFSALAVAGVSPQKIHESVPTPTSRRLPFAPQGAGYHPYEHMGKVQKAAQIAQTIVDDGQHPLDTPEQHGEMVKAALLHLLNVTYQAGKASHPRFERVIAEKIQANGRRFQPDDFSLQPDDDPQKRFAIGYARSKVRVKQWDTDRAVQFLHRVGVNPTLL